MMMESSSKNAEQQELAQQPPIVQQQTLQPGDAPITAVTVFTDRAEVQRCCAGLKLEPGLNRVLIENVAHSIIGDSIRVDGKGDAVTIQEVQFQEKWLDRHKVTSPRIEELRAEQEKLKEKRDAVEEANGLVEKQLTAIGDILTNFGKSALADPQTGSLVHFDSATEQSLEMLYGFHERKSRQLRERSRAQRKEMAELAKKIERVTEQLDELVQKGRCKKSIAVDLESKGALGQDKDVELVLTYQVHNARWSPSYDIRAQMEQQPDNNGQQQQMKSIKIHYYGIISQSSGENWENVRLMLSTAQPSSGQLPKLGTTFAQFWRPEPPAAKSLFGGIQPARAAPRCYPMAGEGGGGAGRHGVAAEYESDEEMGFGCFESEEKEFNVQQTEAKQQPLATTFSIGQPKTIGDGGDEHKVTIAVLDNLDCVPHYDCVPSKNTNVFLYATVLNSSPYPLLAGQASIYLNSCFNQKVRISAVAAGGKFEVPLGVCPAIKVSYKPANKFHHQTGVLNRSSNLVNEQKIVVKNSGRKGQQFLLTVVEPVPKPTDEKIKIRLLSPELTQPRHIVHVMANNGGGGKSGSSRSSISTATNGTEGGGGLTVPERLALLKGPAAGVRLNADNNLEWTVPLEGGQETELTVKWEAEYPPSEKLEFQEKREK